MLKALVAMALLLVAACSEDPQVIVIHDDGDATVIIIDNNVSSNSSSSSNSSANSSSASSERSSNSNRNANSSTNTSSSSNTNYGASDAGYTYDTSVPTYDVVYDAGYDAGTVYDSGSTQDSGYSSGGGASVTIWVTGNSYAKVVTNINTWQGSLSDGKWIVKLGPQQTYARVWIKAAAIKVEGTSFTIWIPGVMPPSWPTNNPQWFQGSCPWHYFDGEIWVNIQIP